MKGKNNLIFINALVFIIYLLIYISLAINHFVIMKLEVTKAWFGSSLILVIFALVFILTMKNKEVSEKALKVIGITFGVIIILSSVLFLIYIKYNKFNDCSIFLIIFHIAMVLNIIHESLMKYKMVYFTMLVLIINLYILYTQT
ncbi:hypothetical protein NGB78_03565 [Staphylococcus arlettae]|uniref:Uncharacterized protein n=5 Tax=Staphylococcus TaxID=1279 RepID=A0A380CDM3_9STAP|nr:MULTISPECIES: hypothetical protein [Staphylococcus]MEB5897444.1 hypothetical protein [Staphylococcus arlettae]MEB6066980.1 hypothetical protein [Staphylococcus arlettae]MEB7421187.1 hypothetical protein [Staphylococcus arlettae]NKE85510.1 hypothetical protein [Staphylococcus arlettae]PNZ55649.1 hypothetical protein CD036_00395 [Staphylococcus arlettae]